MMEGLLLLLAVHIQGSCLTFNLTLKALCLDILQMRKLRLGVSSKCRPKPQGLESNRELERKINAGL